MSALSMSNIKKFVTSKRGMVIIVLVLLLIAGGVYSGVKDKKKTTNDQQSASLTDPQGVAGATSNNNASNQSVDTSGEQTDGTNTPPSGSTPSSTPDSTPSLPPAVYNDIFTGYWYINFGTMTLNQTGSDVTGTYYNGPNAGNGTISGTVSGQTLTGTWSINGAHGPLTLVKATHTLAGSYSSLSSPSSSFKWCGALQGYQFPANCGFAGHWVSKIASNAVCPMDLVRTNNTVSGTYCNGTLTGTISYPINNIKLTGTWKISALTNGHIAFFLSTLSQSPQQVYFQGNYDSTNEWCGGTTSDNQPTPCLKS